MLRWRTDQRRALILSRSKESLCPPVFLLPRTGLSGDLVLLQICGLRCFWHLYRKGALSSTGGLLASTIARPLLAFLGAHVASGHLHRPTCLVPAGRFRCRTEARARDDACGQRPVASTPSGSPQLPGRNNSHVAAVTHWTHNHLISLIINIYWDVCITQLRSHLPLQQLGQISPSKVAQSELI